MMVRTGRTYDSHLNQVVSMRSHKGLSLLELIVVLAIIAILIAVLHPAVQQVRQAAVKLKSQNQQKQIALAVHSYADTHAGQLPSIDGYPKRVFIESEKYWSTQVEENLFGALVPYLGSVAFDPIDPYPFVQLYISPAEPTLELHKPPLGPPYYYPWHPISYPANAQVFADHGNIPNTYGDGMSNTLLLAEKYYVCGVSYLSYSESKANPIQRRPTFADGGPLLNGVNQGDVYPITDSSRGVTRPSRPGVTFQAAPVVWSAGNPARPSPPNGCDVTLPNTPHRSGMHVALADGSCRTISPRITPETFWAAVTPAGGEVLGSDW